MSIFDGVASRCDKYQKIVVSSDSKSRCQHILNNPDGKNSLRQYKLDEDIFPQRTCCDFLVLNDTLRNAYFIELKGRDFTHGIEQLRSAENLLHSELSDYKKLFRLIHTRNLVHRLRTSKINKIIASWHGNFVERTLRYEEEC